jgi:hypothetical protein
VIPEAPWQLIKRLRHPTIESDEDMDEKDPAPSTFWQPIANDGSVDLYNGFNRKQIPNFDETICTYVDPKDGWGAHPGFTVNCGDKDDVKFKLGDEIYSGPFNTRIFWLMGYNVSPIDSVREFKVAYDRRILTEFHSRKHLTFGLRFLFIKLKYFTITHYVDPFKFIMYAKMKDGNRVTGMELKKRLLKVIPPGNVEDPEYPRPEAKANNYHEDFESQIEYLAWEPGAMAADPDDVKSIGPWKYEEFDVKDKREVRAMQILAAWVGNYNMRWENTRLNFVKVGKGKNADWRLKHFFSDVGSGLGAAKDVRKQTNSQVDEFTWRISEPREDGVELSGFQQNNPNPAFGSVTIEDARWMLRKIAGISEKQIWDALSSVHTMSPAERRLAFEKLLSRRAYMIKDFGLAKEFPAIVGRKFNREFSYTPVEKDGWRWDEQKIVKGRLVAIKKK